MSMSLSAVSWALLAALASDDTGVRGRRVRVVAKWPVWNLLRLRSRSPFEDLGSVCVSILLDLGLGLGLGLVFTFWVVL